MTNDKRESLLDCISNLKIAMDSLDICDDQDDDFIIATHWGIKDVITDIEIELEQPEV
jgi:hypothetical protein